MLKVTHDLSTGLGRLARLADDLEVLELPKGDKFSLAGWKTPVYDVSSWIKPCGTAACAVGWCTTFDWAKDLGLKFSHSMPVYKQHTNWDAVIQFFELTEMEALELFQEPNRFEERCECPKAQARHMKEFLRQKDYAYP